MEVTHTFIPTAGTVGLLPMVTYFFLVVAMFVFAGNFIFASALLPNSHSDRRVRYALAATIAAIAGLSYYLIQSYYRDTLAELVSVTNPDDRLTLLRESYNQIGQFRYIDWFITAPLLLIQIVSVLNVRLADIKRTLAGLLMSASFLFFASYIGHQQLSFDNEIQASMKVTWGLIATIDYVFVLFALYRLWKQYGPNSEPVSQRTFRLAAQTTATCWGIYLLGYFLTVTPIDFSWIHISFTLIDLVSKAGISILLFTSLKSLDY
ncbi:bacteriorhodopsin [Spirosoma sp.]|uniref:bacteriorhodopsin n=1 Tax=Spirosoma sp. TaxID=1899569 RepID=UPI003B3A81D1